MALIFATDDGVTDRSVYRNSLSDVNGAILGRRMKFVAASSQYIINNTANWRSADAMGTIAVWFKLDAVAANYYFFTSADTAGNLNYIGFFVRTNKLSLIQRDGVADTTTLIDGSTTLIINRWYRALLVSSGTAYLMYLNGEAEGLSVISGTNNGDWFSDTTLRDNFAIGGLIHSVPAGYMGGSIGEIELHDDPKSADWVKIEWLRTRGKY